MSLIKSRNEVIAQVRAWGLSEDFSDDEVMEIYREAISEAMGEIRGKEALN